MARYAVFLDIDGVFTSTRVQYSSANSNELWSKFDPVAISFMNKLARQYNIEFVLMSTWKNYLKLEDAMVSHWVLSSFRNAGFEGEFANIWKTDPDNVLWMRQGYTRAHEVKHYLEDFGPYDDFLLFDDNDYAFEKVLGVKRLVRTDSENGLLFKHMKNAMSITGNWLEK